MKWQIKTPTLAAEAKSCNGTRNYPCSSDHTHSIDSVRALDSISHAMGQETIKYMYLTTEQFADLRSN
jgi:hypothetical protein